MSTSSRRRGPKNGLLTLSLLAAAGAGASAGAQSPASSMMAPSPLSARSMVVPVLDSPATPATPSLPVFTPVARTQIDELPQSAEKKRIDLSDAEVGLTPDSILEKHEVTTSKTTERVVYEDIDEDSDGDAFDYDGEDEDEDSESDIDSHPASRLAKRSSGSEEVIEGSTSYMLSKRAKKCKKNYKRNKKGKCVKKKKNAGSSTGSARPYAALGTALLAVMLVMSSL